MIIICAVSVSVCTHHNALYKCGRKVNKSIITMIKKITMTSMWVYIINLRKAMIYGCYIYALSMETHSNKCPYTITCLSVCQVTLLNRCYHMS